MRRILLLIAVPLLAVACLLPSTGQGQKTKPALPERTPGTGEGPTAAGGKPGPSGADASVPPLYFFYVVHTHSSDEYLPYTDSSMTAVDPDAAANLEKIIVSMQETLDRHGVKASWHVTGSMAKGFCATGAEQSVFRRLQQTGHEIGAHAHKRSQIQPAYLGLTQDCGITPRVISGLLMEVDTLQGALAQVTLSDAFSQSVALGMTLTTENLAPGGKKNPFDDVCAEFGTGNDMWDSTDTLLFPWRPDYAAQNICAHNPSGALLLVNHVSIDVFIVNNQMPDVLTTASFNQLRSRLDAALAYLAAEKPDHPAVWGFVTHITEYGQGNGTAGPDADAIAALDSFLAYAESLKQQGRITFATVQSIADAVSGG